MKFKHITSIIIIVSICALFTGCSLFGGSTTKPNAPVDVEMTKKLIDEQVFKAITGDVTVKKYLTDMTTSIVENKVETNQVRHNESLKSILITVALIWFGWGFCKLAKKLIVAYFSQGKTMKNFIGLK